MGNSLIPPLNAQVQIVDDTGRPTTAFTRLLGKLSLGTTFSKDATGSLSLVDKAVTLAKIQDIATQMIIARKAAGTGVPQQCTVSDVLDFVTTTRGSILFRGASGWQALGPGTSGNVLQTNGAGADPTWVTPSGGGGTNPALAAHRYWMIMFPGSRDFATCVAEIQMRPTPGGSNQCSGGTAFASDTSAGAAANAFDGNSTTYWGTTTGGASAPYFHPDYIGYDFGVGVTKVVQELSLTSRPTSGGDQMPQWGKLMYSDDNAKYWTAYEWYIPTVLTNAQTVVIKNPAV